MTDTAAAAAAPAAAPAAAAGGGGGGGGGGGVGAMSAAELSVDMHAGFVKRQSEDKDTIEYVLTEHLRMSGVYWGLTGMHLLGRLGDMDGEAIVEWVMRCRHDCGGFGGSEGHDPHILYTLSAVQVLALYDRMDLLDRDAIAKYVGSLQLPDGSFTG